ncbi:MAG: acyl-CoA dehydrogenase [Acidimicrobiales bacterium]
MPIAITDDHVTLAKTASEFLSRHDARGLARALLEAETEERPKFWGELSNLGWLGLHLPEEHGGSGYGMPELVVVVEELGRAVAPGPFVPTVVASAVIAAAGDAATQARLLPGLADGSVTGAAGFGGALTVAGGRASGSAGAVIGGGLADVFVLAAGDDVVVVERDGGGIEVETPKNLDSTRRAARVTLAGAPAVVLPGARPTLLDYARLLYAAEAVGVARECTELAAAYAKVRIQFGRPIAMFQAVKHHCANMAVAVELATSLVWDAARAAEHGGDQFSYTAAMAAALALPAGDLDANLNTQVHGGIGFTWEHDAHLYLRRASAIQAIIDAEQCSIAVTDFARQGVKRGRTVDLPPEAEELRAPIRAFAEKVKGLDETAQRTAMIEEGYAMPHWPKPWGRDATAVEQLVIEQEFAAAGVRRPGYGITGWVILTLIQYATEDQVARWVRPALNQELVWCQLFSEPNAGSDAAGVQTKGTRVEGGWLVSGQKVWTSGAHLAAHGLATVRTNPDAPKHDGITMMVIDMKAEGVEVRPLKQATGSSDFNEVFFNDVFIPDDDVVGPVDHGWTVARATLGNESVSIGGGGYQGSAAADGVIAMHDANPERLSGGAGRIGRYISTTQALDTLNLRSANRAAAGAGPGPEGNITKLVLSENGHEMAAMLSALSGEETAFMEGVGAMAGSLVLSHRAMSIAGGTSEIKRNQIGERILGLPRDPLIN